MSSHNSSMVSKKEEKARNIQVVVRCRPFNAAERKVGSHSVLDCEASRKEVAVRTGGVSDKSARKTYTFDMVFGPSAKQIDVYRSVVCPILDEVILGYNCTVFAYGQTGTGKTFTMEGERSPNEEYTWEEDPLAGIIPRTLHQIFEKLTSNGTEFSVKVSLMEIYNEELFDLLSPSPDVTERLQMFDDPRNKRGVIIKGLEEITVHNKDEVYQILERGAAKRKTASTLMNAYSSRSHSVFSVTIHMKETTMDGEELVKIGKLNLVDLAGSENIGRSGAVDKRAREAGNINQSLLTLGRVITALVERTPHVPYRESKLTRILQDSLGGRTKTSIIATVSPASINLEETLSTLDYANRAKNIMNKPEVNQKLTKRALIKEYTEEIERLKRDLAAAREKNGVYLSSENYESMNSKIVSQEEQIAEFTEKISAMEEEVKRVSELFTDSKRELEQYATDLEEKQQLLQETHRDLQETKQKLCEEEYIVSELKTTEDVLYGTADQLLSTVDVSTSDVSGLHSKLDRKKNVEEHNAKMQETFASQMDTFFSQMQKSVEEQNLKHQGMLDMYRNSVDDLLNTNAVIFSNTISTVAKSFKSIKDLIGTGVSRCLERMLEQESLCQKTKNNLQHTMEEYRSGMEEGLLGQFLPGIRAVMEMNESLKRTMQSHFVLAGKMETMREEMSSFFRDHTQALSRVKEEAAAGICALQAEQDHLKRQISNANEEHAMGISKVILCLQNQLNLLSEETQKNFNGLLNKSDALQVSTSALQQSMQCTDVVESAALQQDKFERSADGLIAEMRQVAAEGEHILEESSEHCGYLRTEVTKMGEKTVQWCETTKASIDAFADGQLAFIGEDKSSAQGLQQNVEESCASCSQQLSGQVREQQAGTERALVVLKEQTHGDQATLLDHKTRLLIHAQEGLDKVLAFLQEDLKQDTPTGTTPQRKDYTYPRVLIKTRPRDELLTQFRKQQQELLAALNTCEPVQEEPVDQDSLEDDVMTSSSDSVISERSCIDDSIMCIESGRAPFFKSKKGFRKENKPSASFLDKSKMSENPTELTAARSKLPLRAQN
uniref:Kinesin family member 11 n=1 Tax=Lepisosteus oculatus TaxID=7918 RepID=W5MJL7_LEPOC|nr:PREDICTED: kinesin-like protein KIF11 [Lepisosteus oculatus]